MHGLYFNNLFKCTVVPKVCLETPQIVYEVLHGGHWLLYVINFIKAGFGSKSGTFLRISMKICEEMR